MTICVPSVRSRAPARAGAVLLVTVALAAPAFAADQIRLAQAGSTGGTLGKTDRNLSGGGQPGPEKSPGSKSGKQPGQAEAGCAKVAGSWTGSIGEFYILKPDRTASHPAASGSWSCKDGRFVVRWSSGYVDTGTVSRDGKQINITNNLGQSWVGSRRSGE